LKEGCYWLS